MDHDLIPRDRRIDQTTATLERALEVIPQATQTNSKAPDQYVRGVVPAFVERAEGCRVWDVDGNEYIDYPMGLGPVNLGHNYPAVAEAVREQTRDGTMYSLPHPLEVDVAELIVGTVPCAEMVRFAKNGHDVTTLAAKLARAYTGRDVIATHGYHGWTDVWRSPGALGVPDAVTENTERFGYNDVESLERIFEDHPDDVAAIVMTPIKFTPPADDFLERVREIADREGALLVFDEILTGFRYAPGGAQEHFGVTPDLACFAKAMANGHPVSALAGRSDVMRFIENDEFTFSMTYAGETISLAAARATIETIRDEDVTDHLWRQGGTLKEGYNDLAEEYDLADVTECVGLGPLTEVTFDGGEELDTTLLESLFQQECFTRGVLQGRHLVSYSHSDEDVAHTLDVYEAALETIADAVREGDLEGHLAGEPVGAPLR